MSLFSKKGLVTNRFIWKVIRKINIITQVSQNAQSLIFSRLRRVIEFTRFARKEPLARRKPTAFVDGLNRSFGFN